MGVAEGGEALMLTGLMAGAVDMAVFATLAAPLLVVVPLLPVAAQTWVAVLWCVVAAALSRSIVRPLFTWDAPRPRERTR
jgi:hypothetical protein